MSIVVFGLTGGVASGKSTVAARFRERGLDVIDADSVARDVVAPDSEGLAEVVAAFGQDVLTDDGRLDRAKLRKRVFDDAAARATLNAIIHPRIAAETLARTMALEERGVMLACYEAALLVENGLADAFRPLVVVAVEPGAQLQRLMDRDAISATDAAKVVAAQLPLAKKIALCDYLIDNNASEEQLLERADEVLEEIRRDMKRRRR